MRHPALADKADFARAANALRHRAETSNVIAEKMEAQVRFSLGPTSQRHRDDARSFLRVAELLELAIADALPIGSEDQFDKWPLELDK